MGKAKALMKFLRRIFGSANVGDVTDENKQTPVLQIESAAMLSKLFHDEVQNLAARRGRIETNVGSLGGSIPNAGFGTIAGISHLHLPRRK